MWSNVFLQRFYKLWSFSDVFAPSVVFKFHSKICNSKSCKRAIIQISHLVAWQHQSLPGSCVRLPMGQTPLTTKAQPQMQTKAVGIDDKVNQ